MPRERDVAVELKDDYAVAGDMVLYGSFGKDFRDRPDARTLVSIVGLNLGFGRTPIVDVAKP